MAGREKFPRDHDACVSPFTSVPPKHLSIKSQVEQVEGFTTATIIEGCNVPCTEKGYSRHPSDCRKFLQCTPSGQKEMNCAPGTVWDQGSLACTYDTSVRCRVGFYRNSDGDRCPGSCQFDCPTGHGNFPHPRDCRRYFHCKKGVAYYRTCRSGMRFDAATSTCIAARGATCSTSADADC